MISSLSQTPISPALILEKVAVSYGVSIKAIKKSGRGVNNEPRAVTIYLLRQLGGLGFKEITTWFDGANIYTINAVYRRMRQKMVLYRRIKQIEGSFKVKRERKDTN